MYKITSKATYKNKVQPPFVVDDDTAIILPGAAPSVTKIAEMFFNNRPMEQLSADLPFNDISHNPLYQKGVDLADLPEIISQVAETQQEAMQQINDYAHKQQPTQADNLGSLNPDLDTPPNKVE